MHNTVSISFRLLFSLVILLSPVITNAQVEMANDFRGEGKIYVVIAIILIILTGFFYLLFKLDRKAKRLEQEVSDRDQVQ